MTQATATRLADLLSEKLLSVIHTTTAADERLDEDVVVQALLIALMRRVGPCAYADVARAMLASKA